MTRFRRIGAFTLLLAALAAAQIQVPLVSMRGTLKALTKKEIVLDAGDDKLITFRRVKKTRFLKGSKEVSENQFTPGAELVIETSRELDGEFDAINVFLGEPPGSSR